LSVYPKPRRQLQVLWDEAASAAARTGSARHRRSPTFIRFFVPRGAVESCSRSEREQALSGQGLTAIEIFVVIRNGSI
jgi:hypothetical protein